MDENSILVQIKGDTAQLNAALEKAQMERAVLLADARMKQLNSSLEDKLKEELQRSGDSILNEISAPGQSV